MSNRQLTAQHVEDVGEVRAVPYERDERLVPRAHSAPVRAVEIRGVEEVALDPPRLVEDLLPLERRIELCTERDAYRAFARSRRRVRAGNDPARVRSDALLPEQLLAVPG